MTHGERDNDAEIEITEEMIDAGERAFYESDPRFETGADRAISIYEAMVRASPGFLADKALTEAVSSLPRHPLLSSPVLDYQESMVSAFRPRIRLVSAIRQTVARYLSPFGRHQ